MRFVVTGSGEYGEGELNEGSQRYKLTVIK